MPAAGTSTSGASNLKYVMPRISNHKWSGAFYQAKQHVLASGASRHKARTLHIYMRFSKSLGHATKRTLSLRSRYINREYSAQFTRRGITVKVVGIRIHFCSPVGPKRSVRIRSGLWPQAVSRLAAFSTNDVGPQT